MKNNILRSLVVLLILSLATFLGLNQVSAPDVLPADGPADQFSAERAVKHVEQIAKVPHPTGSKEAAEARDYLLGELKALGLDGQVQEADSARFTHGTVYSGHIQNVIGRLKGSADGGKAILIAAHYDSVPTAPGASDDGAAVGAMLETLRALKEGPQLKHDVIFLFTDGEEAGLLGANAFVKEHPWAKDVGLVLNFEARGYKGPAFMFETSDGNGWVMNEFTKAAEHPVANSMLYDMYKLLPNDTDLTVFKGAGMSGLNFAYAIGLNAYHNRIDTVETMDPESLQHHGSYMLSLTKHFGMLDSLDAAAGDRNQVYFNLFKHVLVDYSQTWVIPLTAVVTLLFLFVLITGLRSGVLRAGGLLKGLLGFLLAIVGTGGVAMGAWTLVNALQPDMNYNLVNDPDFFNVYAWGFALLSVAVFSGLYSWIRRWASAANLMGGSILLFWLLTLAVTFLLPGGSYLFTWPLFFSLIGWYLLIKSPDGEIKSIKDAVIQTLLAVPAVLLFAPLVYLVLVLVSLSLAGVVFALLAIMMGLLVPHVLSFLSGRTWRFPTAAVVTALLIFVISGFTLDISAQNPTYASVIYGKNDNTGKAVYATATPLDDPWLEQFLTDDPEVGPLSEVLHPLFKRDYRYAEAPDVKEEAPKLEVLSDTTSGDVRTLKVKIMSQRGAHGMSVTGQTEGQIIGGSVWGKTFESDGTPFILNYASAPEKGLELTLQIKPAGKVTLDVEDTTFGFPNVAGKSYSDSPDSIMAMKRVIINKKHEL
ncbi:peptidase M28-like protein [Tumebacillus sp. BK434]|uniref:M20/M25/M40 family metallo-hydrolase n=1 Tax=Tumebacillus sp. BK434 TaxID=2512169 RepID=UPI001050C97D|nr:M20/M25/M40 family metallo-hydrolase [Tumebacillus sp. BK434]TCP58077.1 peptidase M28-like protein [Tumebacillus sp. BK434]